MELIEFRKINLTDIYDDKYNDGFAWSRVYEYPLILQLINQYKPNDRNILIHNTSWGFGGIHIKFKDALDEIYPNCVHSDIKNSNLKNTFVYNITLDPPIDWINKYDVVINVSTLEEVNFDHITIFNNLYKQLKNDGYLIITFDYPGLQLDKFETMFNQKLKVSDLDINGENSKVQNKNWYHLSCGLIVIKKTS